jgi:hypothetical protein
MDGCTNAPMSGLVTRNLPTSAKGSSTTFPSRRCYVRFQLISDFGNGDQGSGKDAVEKNILRYRCVNLPSNVKDN